MTTLIDIRPLTHLDMDEILPIVSGYESGEKYAIEKTETEEQTVINIRLVKLATLHRTTFSEDFNPVDAQRFREF